MNRDTATQQLTEILRAATESMTIGRERLQSEGNTEAGRHCTVITSRPISLKKV